MTTKKKMLVGIGGLVAVVAGPAFVYRADLQLALMMVRITPDQPFSEAAPAPPDN
jgi:hypothetical protein